MNSILMSSQLFAIFSLVKENLPLSVAPTLIRGKLCFNIYTETTQLCSRTENRPGNFGSVDSTVETLRGF